MQVETQIGIAAPAERIWRVWTDVEHWSDWTPSVTWVRRLDTGEFGVGSRAAVKQPSMRPMVWEVTESTPGESFVWTARTAGTTLVAGHRLSPGPDGTTTATLSMNHTGLLAPALGVLVGGRIKRYLALEADGIRRFCEAA
ncbi:SRPBCC family protein [Actinocatenispora rupis]|uniref:Polyketide cyclase / dehydrase and lipid transport n=1 Tax=Actinocatenispora rupis TaxID=519421 RepID=A0A8J3IY72_9ACTN|nr:SRPBCC family protein [Actinocatenispora rupis]GID10838.1 hypothetical protein Aru02nite_17270 [Actinocatenispora rupis]